jgi:hypothetical protein
MQRIVVGDFGTYLHGFVFALIFDADLCQYAASGECKASRIVGVVRKPLEVRYYLSVFAIAGRARTMKRDGDLSERS